MKRPKPGDYIPYYDNYISKVEGDDAIKEMEEQLPYSFKYFKSIPESKGKYFYA